MNETPTILNRRKCVALFVGLAVVMSPIMFLSQRPREPSYQGKPLSKWLRGFEYENLNPSEEARTALRAMGEPAVARLIAILETNDSALKRKFIDYARRRPGVHNRVIAPRHIIPENVYHAQAATALGEIGPAAHPAIPALMKASTNNYYLVAARAKAALMKIRQEPVTALVLLLEDPRSTRWAEAVLTVKYLGANGQAAVPLLVKALHDTNDVVRSSAAAALGGIACNPEIAVPALIDCLSDKSPDMRRDALDALCKFRTAKEQIVPVLLPRLQDPDLNVWLGAAFGLEDLLGYDEKKTILGPGLTQSLNSPNATIRENAALFLKRIDPAAPAKAGIK